MFLNAFENNRKNIERIDDLIIGRILEEAFGEISKYIPKGNFEETILSYYNSENFCSNMCNNF